MALRTSLPFHVVVAALSFGCLGAHCNGTQVAKTVLDAVELSCVLFHDDIEEDAKLAKVCGIAEELLPEVRKVVFARKSAAAKKAAAQPSSSVK